MNLMEFEQEFSTEKQCLEYLFKLRWENGYRCLRCQCDKAWQISEAKYMCRSCGYQMSVITGTIFQDTHKPLTLWFRAIWYITSQKNGTNALGLQQILGLESYHTAWLWLHKLRRAMIRPGTDKLKGMVEVDEAYIDSPGTGGERGRGASNKVLVAIAVEIYDHKIGRIRMSVINSASSENLHAFIETVVEAGGTIVTDGWLGYNGLSEKGYLQAIKTKNTGDEETLLPHVHTVIFLLKRWLLGKLQGSVSKEHISHYLDEYSFRFNRRKSKSRGMLFYKLLQNAVQLQPTPYTDIIVN